MKFVSFITIEEEGRVFESLEQNMYDEIFVDDTFFSTIESGKIYNNKKYNNPDYTRHVLSYMCNDVYFMDEKNIPLPVSNVNNISMFVNNNLSDIDKELDRGAGVYIIERYIINNYSGLNINYLIEHYYNTCKIDIETLKDISNKLNKSTPEQNAVIRFVTYIPNMELYKYKYVYSESTNLCIFKGLPDVNIKHPKSKLILDAKKIRNIKEENASTHISLDIIDNNNHHKPYYIQIGKNIERILSHPSDVNKDGCILTIKKNKNIIESNEYKLEDLKKIGIFENEDDVRFDNNIENKIKLKRLELEDKKLLITDKKVIIENKKNIIEDNKVALSFANMQHEKFNNILDKEVKIASIKSNKFKQEVDYLGEVLSFSREKTLMEDKLINEQIKMGSNVLSFIQGAIKIMM